MRIALAMAALLLLSMPVGAHAAIPEDKIKIGILQDLPDPYADATGNGGIVAAQLAASDYETEYLRTDAEILPDASQGGLQADVDQVRDWLDKEHVAAVLSSANADVNRQIAKMVAARRRTLLVAEAVGGSADKLCSPSAIVWGPGMSARARALAHVFASEKKNHWYLVTEQTPSGVASHLAVQAAVGAVGGQLVGDTELPVGARDLTTTIDAIGKSNADVVALGQSDGDLLNALRSLALARPPHPLTITALAARIFDIDAAGPDVATGVVIAAPYYWETNGRTRDFAYRWETRMQGRHVTQNAAEVYAATISFLRAATAADDVDAGKVGAELRRAPIKDTLFGTVQVRNDGRVVYDLPVYRVKTSDQIQERWDYYDRIATIPGAQAFPPGACGAAGSNKTAGASGPVTPPPEHVAEGTHSAHPDAAAH